MKLVQIEAYHIGLVFKNGTYKKILGEGTHFVGLGRQVSVYQMGTQFVPTVDLGILLQYSEIANTLQVVEVNDNELALQYENGRFQRILTVGQYAFWKGIKTYDFVKADMSKVEITEPINKTLLAQMTNHVRSYVVESYEQGLLFIDGKFEQILAAGTYYWWKNDSSIQVAKADMRQLQLEVSGQEILTKDKANLRLNFYVQYQITDIEKALYATKDHEKQLYVLLQLALRAYIGNLTLDELLEKKDNLAQFILENTKEKVAKLGVEVKNGGVRDIILPGDMKEIINQVLMAEKKAQANVIMRREETASTRSLLNTAKLMEDNAMLWKLKEMEYVEKIADKINTISVSGNGQILDQLKQIFVKN
jgi:regulator of protease activity HflC (stomatin/prohibitin superfamily)